MSQDIEQALRKKIPRVHRERILWEASREYMRGNLSAKELEEIEYSTSPHPRPTSPLPEERYTGENNTKR